MRCPKRKKKRVVRAGKVGGSTRVGSSWEAERWQNGEALRAGDIGLGQKESIIKVMVQRAN